MITQSKGVGQGAPIAPPPTHCPHTLRDRHEPDGSCPDRRHGLPAPAAASHRSAAHQSQLARICDTSSGSTRAYYSYSQYSKVNAILCVETVRRPDGSQALQASYSTDIFYSWGGAWYADCNDPCSIQGIITLRRGNGALVEESLFGYGGNLTGNQVRASETFNVDRGQWRVEAQMSKMSGYWGVHGSYSEDDYVVRTSDFRVEVEVP